MPAPLLVTGFAPFDGAEKNASWQAVQGFAERWNDQTPLEVAELPVEFETAGHAITELVEALEPVAVIAVGLADGRVAITPERVAINVRDARIPDNAGHQPVDEPIDPHGPAAYFTTLPLRASLVALAERCLPGQVSNSAGTYVCNEVFYRLMACAASRPELRAGFVHIPQATEYSTAETPTLPLALLADGLEIVARSTMAASR